jgi:phosphate starvation-inducible PhoH-like protein
MTRVGQNSRIIFVGDTKQNDLLRNKNDVSGLVRFMTVLKRMEEFSWVEFTTDDIIRSGLVKSFLMACEEEES